MKKSGFYIIKEQFFEDMNEPYLKGNKKENRPHYYCFEDENTGIYWMIPLSSKIEKYRKIMEKREAKGKTCDILHILRLDDKRESVFLIQDMFPITEQYIEREYKIANNHLMLTSEQNVKVIERKAKKVRGMLKRRVKFMTKTATGAEADRKVIDVDSLVSMNMWGLTPEFLDVLEEGFKEFFEKEVPGNPLKAEYLIPIFIGELLEQGKMSVKVLKTNDTWYGMTYHEDVAAVKDSFKKMLADGVYKADLFSDL